jgi:hypothetical protein
VRFSPGWRIFLPRVRVGDWLDVHRLLTMWKYELMRGSQSGPRLCMKDRLKRSVES